MGTNTPNYQLFKPNPDADNVNVVTDLNNNYDIIDTEIKAVDNKIIPILMKRKISDESLASNTTLQTDDELFINVIANTVYALDSYIIYSGAPVGSGGIKIDWTIPSGATLNWTSYGTNGHGVGTNTDYDVVLQSAAGIRNYSTNSGVTMTLQPKGILVVGGTAGVITMRWAQATAHATATIVKAGSWLRLMKFV